MATQEEAISTLVDAFEKEHPERVETVRTERLQNYLEQVYAEVLRGEHLAKSDDVLEEESGNAGISRQEYEALVNLAAHAAADGATSQHK